MDTSPIQGIATVGIGALAFILVMAYAQYILKSERRRSASDEDEH